MVKVTDPAIIFQNESKAEGTMPPARFHGNKRIRMGEGKKKTRNGG